MGMVFSAVRLHSCIGPASDRWLSPCGQFVCQYSPVECHVTVIVCVCVCVCASSSHSLYPLVGHSLYQCQSLILFSAVL